MNVRGFWIPERIIRATVIIYVVAMDLSDMACEMRPEILSIGYEGTEVGK